MTIRHCGVLALLILAGVVPGGWLGEASAQQPTPEQIAAIRQSCRSDFMSHCAGVQPGGREALQCLKRNAASVSAPCKSALDAVGPKPAAAEPEPAARPPANTLEPAAAAPQPAPAEPAQAAPPPAAESPPDLGRPRLADRARGQSLRCRRRAGQNSPSIARASGQAVPPRCDACKSTLPRCRRRARARLRAVVARAAPRLRPAERHRRRPERHRRRQQRRRRPQSRRSDRFRR